MAKTTRADFLPGVHIWGASLCSRAGDILHHTIPNWLKWCDKILLMMDNEDEKTMKICQFYKDKYPGRIVIEHTGFSKTTPEQEKKPKALFHRFKPLQGPIRDKVFESMRKKENVDILVFPDSDELFTNEFPSLLEDFWGKDQFRAITMKPVDVFGDFMTIHNRSMTGHTRVMKFADDITAVPYRTACLYRPFTKTDRMGSSRVLVHLANLNNLREWRMSHWKGTLKPNEPLWKLPRDIRKMTYEEMTAILKQEPDLNAEEYVRGGDKRSPVGTRNAERALREASHMLNKMGIRHYLAFGTALGVVRDKELIKWDWDIDLVMLGEDLPKFDKQMALKNGFIPIKIKQDLPQKMWDGEEGGALMVRTIAMYKYGVRVDIDPAYRSPDFKYRYILKGRKRQKFAAKHPYDWFAYPAAIKFKGRIYNVPNPVEDYLESNYGKEWKKPTYMVMSWHRRPCYSQNYECEV